MVLSAQYTYVFVGCEIKFGRFATGWKAPREIRYCLWRAPYFSSVSLLENEERRASGRILCESIVTRMKLRWN
jgi:hypothetical protein